MNKTILALTTITLIIFCSCESTPPKETKFNTGQVELSNLQEFYSLSNGRYNILASYNPQKPIDPLSGQLEADIYQGGKKIFTAIQTLQPGQKDFSTVIPDSKPDSVVFRINIW